MDDTDHSISQHPLAGADIQGFDYGGLDAEKAEALRNAARTIRGIQHDALDGIGRQLLEAKKLLGHGPFLRWADAELGIKPRTAQNYMAAAQFIEGKCETIAHLPANLLYKLSAPSAPADVVEAVVAASTTETPMPVDEINRRLADAREEEKEIQQEIARAKGALSREEAKAQRAQRKADRAAADAAWKRKEAKRRDEEDAARQRKVGREERITPVIELIARSLSDEHLLDLVDLLKDMSGHRFIISILSAEQNSRIPPPPEDQPIVPTIDPTDWQNKRDYCLTHVAGLTGTQQGFIAALHGNPSSEQLAKLEHIYGTARRVQS